MSSQVARSPDPALARPGADAQRIAFVGAQLWLDGCAPVALAGGSRCERFVIAAGDDGRGVAAALARFRPHATVVFDPASLSAELLGALPGVTLGVLVAGAPQDGDGSRLEAIDRLLAFDPALTGAQIGAGEIWRAVPPPVSDALFAEVRPARAAPRALCIGRSTDHREAVLIAAKHHHDLLHVIHGVSGQALAELLAEYDVGVYTAPADGGGFGHQVGVHLAAGQLLLAEELAPAHGLEREIDYLQFDSGEALLWTLDRLGRFPEMHQRVRVRGRLKAEQYRASTLFARVIHDLFADVSAFGGAPAAAQPAALVP